MKCNQNTKQLVQNKHGASKIIDTFETYHPMVREYSRHYRYFSLVMIINRIGISMMIPMHSRRTFVIEPQMLMSYSLCFCDTCNIQDLIIGISIPSSISLPTLPFTCSRDIPSPWPSHMLKNWMISHRVGPEYLSVMQKNKSRSWCICLNILHWKPKRYLFNHRITEWRLMQSKLPPEVVIKHDLMV
jgi:hypothetical protein